MEKRLLCADLVRLYWNVRTLEGVLEDISSQGACVQVEEGIPPDEEIWIAEPDGRMPLFKGLVKYCERRDYGYLVGIDLSGPTAWSSPLFEPQHVTNPATLLN